MNEIPKLLTVRECSKKLNISYQFINQLIKNNKIVYFQSGKKRLINFDSLCNYLKDGRMNDTE